MQYFGSTVSEEFGNIVLLRKSTKIYEKDMTRSDVSKLDLVNYYVSKIGGQKVRTGNNQIRHFKNEDHVYDKKTIMN